MNDVPIDTAERQARFAQRFIGIVPHVAALGIVYRGHGSDWAELAMPFAPHLIAAPDFGVIASGAIYSLMDTAAGIAVTITRGAFVPHATLDMRLDYLRAPAPEATVIARAECYRMTRQIGFVRGIAHDGDPANAIANMAGTFMFTAAPEPQK